MARYILDDDKVLKYAGTRLLGKEISHRDVNTIELYNGYMPHMIIEEMKTREIPLKKVKQENEREPIYYSEKNKILLIPQYSSKERGIRYETMIRRFSEVVNRNFDRTNSLKFNIHQRKSEETGEEHDAVTDIEYSNMWHDFVVRLFLREPRYEQGRIFPTMNIQDIDTVIFGPVKAVERHAKVLEKGREEYLKSQIIEIEGKKALNIDYVYGSQGGGLIEKLAREFNSIAGKRDKSKKAQKYIYTFSRMASLDDKYRQNDIGLASSIINWSSLEEGKRLLYEMDNCLCEKDNKGRILNVTSVIDQTIEQLELARQFGCVFVEMEQRKMMEAVFSANDPSNRNINVRYGFVGHISDLPLHGITLADEFDCSLGEDRAIKVIKEHIRKQN